MKSIPRVRFAHLPTPVEALPRLSAEYKGPNFWVKRDDQTGLATGGNKSRKLEFFLAEAMANGARTLITAGAAQSNHCRQTAASAARFGLGCILVLTQAGVSDLDLPSKPSSPDSLSGNLLLDALLGAEIVWAEPEQRDQALNRSFEIAWQAGQRPYLIPYGGSNPTGAVSFVLALQELLDQCRESGGIIPKPDWIVFASSSSGTQAGLVLGARQYGFEGGILGISVDKPASILREMVAALANETASYLDLDFNFTEKDVQVNDMFLGEGYGVLGERERDAIHTFASLEGILLDPVYTGRAAAGMLSLAREGYFKAGENILFWHTGGLPALFADRYRSVLL